MTLKLFFSVLMAIGLGILSLPVYAAKEPKLTAMTPEILSAKALLEDVLSRRYTAAMATKLEKKSFVIDSMLDLRESPTANKKSDSKDTSEPLSDLMLGQLDPEAILKALAGPDEKLAAQRLLSSYRIQSVEIGLGLNEALTQDQKTEAEKWLAERVKTEFGNSGKIFVSTIKVVPEIKREEKAPPKETWQWLQEFQPLAGHALLALAGILGVLLWQILTPRKSTDAQAPASSNIQISGAPNVGRQEGGTSKEEQIRVRELEESNQVEVANITTQIEEILPRVSVELESIIRAWCQTGEPGMVKLASLTEVASKKLGKLPIPVDSMNNVSRVFARMTKLDSSKKKESLKEVYWDLLTAVTLGSSALERPFGYVGGLNIGLLSQSLIEENPKMKTLVTLYMPDELRARFVNTLEPAQRLELLETASRMTEIGSQELKDMDKSLLSRLKPTSNVDMVPLDMTFMRMVSALSIEDEIQLLPKIKGRAAIDYRRTVPSLAFLGQWPDEKLSVFINSLLPDEMVAFCRVREDLKDRMIKLAPGMTADVASDELARPDKMSSAERVRLLQSMKGRLDSLFSTGAVNLEELFPVGKDKVVSDSEVSNDGEGRREAA